MRKVIRCGQCSKACISYGVGFMSVATLHCEERQYTEVAEDDGSTFGQRGEHPTIGDDVIATIEEHAAVYGWDDDW